MDKVKKQKTVEYVTKTMFAFLLYGLWVSTQILLNHSKEKMGGTHFDFGHAFLAPVNAYLHNHERITNALLIITSADIDIFMIGLAIWGILGKTTRPLLGILFILFFRQVSLFLVSAPIPDGMIWHYPGFPSLIVTYYTTFDFFFSGHAACATFAVLEVWQRHYQSKVPLIITLMLLAMQIFCILAMRFHYTADVITGIFAAVTAFVAAYMIAPSIDRGFGRFVGKVTGGDSEGLVKK